MQKLLTLSTSSNKLSPTSRQRPGVCKHKHPARMPGGLPEGTLHTGYLSNIPPAQGCYIVVTSHKLNKPEIYGSVGKTPSQALEKLQQEYGDYTIPCTYILGGRHKRFTGRCEGVKDNIRIRRCPWCNGYRHRKWTRRHEFKSWTRLIAFHIALIPLGKVLIQLFSLQLWVNSRTD